ncbi:hypothetical protein [Mycoplasma struthionis]|uniref:Uncharacterized protein n=1 Tax=Mycoplasma struthionis TaxID=538220 RepID=A0A502M8D7_9MOLU|nr:hypothetical protein [Mycoplasma struthionis]TPI01143.1 hypothetical protein FJM01_02930 [Mycoplasma struthionis]
MNKHIKKLAIWQIILSLLNLAFLIFLLWVILSSAILLTRTTDKSLLTDEQKKENMILGILFAVSLTFYLIFAVSSISIAAYLSYLSYRLNLINIFILFIAGIFVSRFLTITASVIFLKKEREQEFDQIIAKK